jgi:DNA end-binding protein Ku
MARAIWKGSISFGLVSIPVGLFSAETRDEISFRQLDKRNLAPVGYKKYNKQTGKEVEGDDIVKGYEYEDERYVLISDEDLKRANPEKTQTVDITDFVNLDDIDPEYFDKPYYLAYALLREALKRSGKVGIAKVVIRSREYLGAVIPHNDVLILEILRYPHEIRGVDDLELPGEELEKMGVTDREVKMAEMLIDGMTADWEPAKYHDSYRDDLMALIHKKIESGQTEVLDESPAPEVDAEPKGVIDIMSLLKKSVEATSKHRGAVSSDDEEEEEEEEARPAAKRKPAKSAAKSGGDKPKSAQPAKPRTRVRKSA